MKRDEKNLKYYQFLREQNFPLLVAIENNFICTDFYRLLREFHFSELTETDLEAIKKTKKDFRVLVIKEASLKVSMQLRHSGLDDRYGPESLTNMSTHKVYRYKHHALLVYSFISNEWQLGCHHNFGDENNKYQARVVLNRFLSWALANMGIVGFWGTPVEEGVVITRPIDSMGEAIFIDIKNMQLLTVDGIKKIPAQFKIIRLDSTLINKTSTMRREELVGFLSSHTVYFDLNGNSTPIRQTIQEISSMTVGILHPEKFFKPRTQNINR